MIVTGRGLLVKGMLPRGRSTTSPSSHFHVFVSCREYLLRGLYLSDVCIFESVVEQLPYYSDRYSLSVFLTSKSKILPGVLARQILAFGANPSVAVLPIQRLFGGVRYGPSKCVQDKQKKLLHLLPSDFAGAIDKDASDVSNFESFVILLLASGGCRFSEKTWYDLLCLETVR